MPPGSVLIIGASRGLGLALTKHYASTLAPQSPIFATIRSPAPSQSTTSQSPFPSRIKVIGRVDCMNEDVGDVIVKGLEGATVQVVFFVSGILKPEEFGKSSWKDEVAMYTVGAIAPVSIIEKLVMSSSLAPDAKIVLLTSEAGSLALRTESEGGQMYGHHGSKAAGNMIGKLLSYDLKPLGIPIAMIHPGFLKTEMTKGAGMEQFYEKMGAITPDEAAGPLTQFAESLTMEMSGKLWAPLGAKGIGNAEEVMGKHVLDIKGPLELPW